MGAEAKSSSAHRGGMDPHVQPDPGYQRVTPVSVKPVLTELPGILSAVAFRSHDTTVAGRGTHPECGIHPAAT
ncbi:hypothetical protein NDU88_006167 [Pleurodeles waltl]|uniref:Uncharacterized protein n=1 Tax=Pleurodeles waltl TaxID=8319 RepID=A0AAV7NPJ8_PLEWA|nr:hypothetical protein NDU88_006167 [Pleurodeles waltl]